MSITKKAHFIGIAGKGMSAVAILLKEAGWHITGSDDGCYPPVSTFLEDKGIKFNNSYSKENIPTDTDIFVIGKTTKLDPTTNKEVEAAIASGREIKSFPEVLNGLTKEKRNLVIAGSSGKSTVTAMTTWCLKNAGKDPSYFIGAIPNNMETTAHIGKDDVFVLEGDEYPTSHTDNDSKFLYYNPTNVLLISAEHDHYNVFPNLESYLKPFRELLGLVPATGKLIACTDNPNISELIQSHEAITYGLDKSKKPKWSADNIKIGEITTFDVTKNGEVVVQMETKMLGMHNVQNIVGVTTLLSETTDLKLSEISEGIKSFSGIESRLDLKTPNSLVPVYGSYGSSREKALADFRAIKSHFPNKRFVILFEPHTFSWRSREALKWYDDVFQEADEVILFKPLGLGDPSHDRLTQEEIVERVRQKNTKIKPIKSEQEGLDYLKESVTDNDIILVTTSGRMDGLVESAPKLIEKLFPIK